ncbi:MAG: hypothetical protein RQ751_03820 [Longimicrobiales bacterium]|nr:hypothetical protein [Longimicrobiales bacterium]
MLALSRLILGLSSVVGGVVALLSGDFGIVLAALGLAVLGFIPVSILLMPGLLVFGGLATALGDRVTNATSGPALWVAAVLGTANSSIIQIVWLFACLFVLGNATDGSTPPWAAGLLVIGAAYGVWEWLAMKDLQAGNTASAIQRSHFAVGLTLFYLTLMMAPDAMLLALVLLVGSQFSAIPRMVELERLRSSLEPPGLHHG